MKLFIQLFILLLSLGILYPANATEADKAPTIILNISNLPLPDVLVIIEKQSEMSFSYESSVIKDIPKVTLQVNQVPLRGEGDGQRVGTIAAYLSGKVSHIVRQP